MSAFMFRIAPEAVKKLTDEELEYKRKSIEATLANVNWEKLKQCTFEFDLAYGRSASLHMIEQEIALRKEGNGDKPIQVPLVPGYNPGPQPNNSCQVNLLTYKISLDTLLNRD